ANLDVNFFNALRSAAGRYQLAFLTGSAHPLIQLTYSGRSQEILSSPFFNIFAPLFLGLLPEDEARQLIVEPAEKTGAPFSEENQSYLYNLVGGHPLGLQVACFHAFDTPDDQREIEHQTKDELSAHFQYYWNNLSPAEKDTLHHLSDAATRSMTDTTLRGLLRDLIQKCLLAQDEGGYRHPSKAWEDFVNSQQQAPRPVFRGITHIGTGGKIGQYEVLDPIARGGMSEIYKGRHTRLNRDVAIKVLPAGLATEADFRTRFEREARAIASLRHNNIVQVFDFGDVENTYFMVMEFIDGHDLAHNMRETGPFSFTETHHIMEQIASAIDYAHQQGFVHRDIKPSNVMIEQKGSDLRAVLTDFGIAKIRAGDTGATKTGMMMGTLNYMAPEQIRSSGQVDGKADIYALGVMLFQMLTGQLPFVGDNPGNIMMAHLQKEPPNPQELVPEIPDAVAKAILKALEKEPEDRLATAGELAAAFMKR
ncbi:MAG: serine/threonine-protein kinase, partial [Chloroflexota bacterium]